MKYAEICLVVYEGKLRNFFWRKRAELSFANQDEKDSITVLTCIAQLLKEINHIHICFASYATAMKKK